MFRSFGVAGGGPINLFTLFLSERFRHIVENWEQASTTLYFRLQSAAAHSEKIRGKFDAACQQGMFDHISDAITLAQDIPVYVPIILRQPDGSVLQITSLLGQLVSVHDALVEGFEVELMVPVDEQSEACMLANRATE